MGPWTPGLQRELMTRSAESGFTKTKIKHIYDRRSDQVSMGPRAAKRIGHRQAHRRVRTPLM